MRNRVVSESTAVNERGVSCDPCRLLLSAGTRFARSFPIMSNEQKEHDRLSLDEVRRLTAAIAREEDPSLEVVAATNAEGAEHSSEVVLERGGGATSQRVVVRVDRYGSESELRPIVRERLRAAARSAARENQDAAADDPATRVDELAADLDDLQTIADEIQEQPPSGVKSETVQRLKRALSEATTAADDVEDEIK
jgi:hypothetical protein